MKTVKMLLFAVLLFVSCDFSFEEDLMEDLSTTYTYFASDDENAAHISETYIIDSVLNPLPDFQDSNGVNKIKAGYYPDGWNFWKYPETGSEGFLIQPNSSYTDKNGVFTIHSMSVGSNPIYFYAAGWTPITYYVRFNANGGSGSMENQEMSYDTSCNLNTNQFTRNGYEFKGWGKSTSDTAVSYSDGDSVKNLTQAKGGFVDLYAIWWKTTITISFDANGGSGSMSEISAKVGETAVPACSFTAPTGHSFSYWTCNLTPYDYYAGDILTESNFPNDDCVFKANWKANPVTLTLSVDGNTLTQTCYYGTPTTISYMPEKNNYIFAGWSESASSSTVSYASGARISLTAPKTLYAVWKGPRFSLNTPTVSTVAISYSATSSVTLTASSSATSYLWYIDGAKKSDTSSCTINYADYSAGTHTISLVCITVSSGSATVKQYENTFTIAN